MKWDTSVQGLGLGMATRKMSSLGQAERNANEDSDGSNDKYIHTRWARVKEQGWVGAEWWVEATAKRCQSRTRCRASCDRSLATVCRKTRRNQRIQEVDWEARTKRS